MSNELVGELNNFSSFKEKVERWSHDFLGTRGVKLAIARKAPRMVELCKLKKWLKEEECANPIVSEYALPFIAKEMEDEVAIADDAIYFGSTFERICGLTLTAACLFNRKIKPDKVRAVPAVLSEGAKFIPAMSDQISVNKAYLISKDEIPFYINTLISDFQLLGKPYDVEFPLIYLTAKEGIPLSDTLFEGVINKIVEELKPRGTIDKPYKLIHFRSGSEFSWANWNIVLNNLSERSHYIVCPEFRKIRLFMRGSRLCIASFAPHIFADHMLVDDSPLFRGTKLAVIWNKVYLAALLPLQDRISYEEEYRPYLLGNPGDDAVEARWKKQVDEYLYHRRNSLVIWANYLLSFAMLLDIKQELTKATEDHFFIEQLFDITDLTYLLGEKLSLAVISDLELLFWEDEAVVLPLVGMNKLSHHDQILPAYKDSFNARNHEDFAKCDSVSELISCNFSNQHRFLEISSRKDYLGVSDRLSFGESYTSLTSKAAVYFSGPELSSLIHRAMDERIDMGSVVPKYVRLSESEDAPWLRLFRSGENEDRYKDQLLRILWLMLSSLAKEYNSKSLPDGMIHCCFNLIAGNLADEELFEHLGGIDFATSYTEKEIYVTSFRNETGDSVELLEYATRYNLLQPSQTAGFSILQKSDWTDYLEGGTTLDLSTTNLVANYAKVACFISRHSSSVLLREFFNWMIPLDYEKISRELADWKEKYFIPALASDMKQFVFSDAFDIAFIEKIHLLMQQFPSFEELDEFQDILKYQLANQPASVVTSLLPRLLIRSGGRRASTKDESCYKDLDSQIERCYALAFLAFNKFMLSKEQRKSEDIEEDISSFEKSSDIDKMKGNESFDLLLKMKNTDTFDEVTDEEAKRIFLHLLQFG